MVGGRTTNDNVQIIRPAPAIPAAPACRSRPRSTAFTPDHVHPVLHAIVYLPVRRQRQHPVGQDSHHQRDHQRGQRQRQCAARQGNNTVTLGNGNDNVQAGDGNNTVTLGNGNDNVQLGTGNNTVTLGNGNDNVQAGNGNNTITIGNGNDKSRSATATTWWWPATATTTSRRATATT